MSETLWIVLIVAIAFVVVLVVFRDKLSEFKLKIKGMKTSMKTHTPNKSSGLNIRGNILDGKRSKIVGKGIDINIEENVVMGEDQKISAESSDD